jgi:D-alanyl-D-alanine carboxypeptidase
MLNMKPFLKMILFFFLFSFFVSMTSYAKARTIASATPPHKRGSVARTNSSGLPAIRAGGWVIMDAQTGEIYEENNPDGQFYPASITKILTTTIALQKLNLNQTITISSNANKVDGTQLALPTGTQLSVQDALYAMMLQSANDAAVAVAEAVSGSETNFAQLMNSEATSMGATHSHFVTANGLHNKDHYTTAHDMAVITRYAMQNPEFQKMASTKIYPWKPELFSDRLKRQMPIYAKEAGIPYDGNPELINHNEFVFQYPDSIGIKNGFTDQASFTLVGGAKRGDVELIGVFMHAQSKETAYPDMAALMNYTFPIAEKRHQDISLPKKQAEASQPVAKPSTTVALPKSIEGPPFPYHNMVILSSILGVCLFLVLRGAIRSRKQRMKQFPSQQKKKTVNG